MDDYLLLRPRQNFVFRKRWITTILTSIDGSEQRSSLIDAPKRVIAFSPIGLTPDQFNHLRRRLFMMLPYDWGIPLWQDETRLTQKAEVGNSVIYVDSTAYRNFEVGGYCLLLNESSEGYLFEVRGISSFTSTSITLSSPLTSGWEVGTTVYPLLEVKIGGEIYFNPRCLDIGDWDTIEAVEKLNTNIVVRTPDMTPFSTYLNYYVFPFCPHPDVKVGIYFPYQKIVFLGAEQKLIEWEEAAHKIRATFSFFGKSSIQEMIDFFDYHKGRFLPFWIPTFQRDMVVTQPFEADDTQIYIKSIQYGTYWEGSSTAKYVAFRWKDGELRCNHIVDFGSNYIILEEAVGRTSPTDLNDLTVSFLLFGRFDIDELELEYVLSDLVFTRLSFVSLPLETP